MESPIASKRSRIWAEHGAAVGTISVCAILLAAGWHMFKERMVDRDARAHAASGEVARIWGGPLMQPQPEVRWRRADAATVELEAGELAATDVRVDLDVDYRRRGITEYPGYDAKFTGQYDFKNPSGDAAFVAFTIGLPVDRAALMLRDLHLLVDGKEDAAHTEYAPDRIAWRGRVDGGRAARFTLAYRARGLERFGYRFSADSATARPVTAFKFALAIRNLKGELDFPIGSMAPTSAATVDGARVLGWDVERLLTSFDVGVVLPDRSDVAAALGRLINNAQYFYILYAAGLLLALSTVRRRARVLHIIGLSVSYFLYFPLATYLSAYLSWPVAAALAIGGISGLAVLHAQRFISVRVAGWVALVQLFFLATPAVAYLLPAHTGLILVIAGFIALGSGLQFVGQVARAIPEEEEAPPRAPAPLPEPRA